jgi:two-component system, NarL family, nitrate/nitrite response regulator NarL
MVAEALTVLIADDHDLFAASLEAFLGTEEAIAVVGRASNGKEAMRLATETRPDVVLMDISMPLGDGFEAARMIRDALPETSVLFLTGSNAPTDIAEARASGGAGYVTKDKIASDLVGALRSLETVAG